MLSSIHLGIIIAIRTAIVMLFLVVGFRIFGKRQMGQLNIYDLSMIMLVANAVQNAMTEGKGNLSVGIAASGSLILVGMTLSYLVARKPAVGRLISGTPTVLISQGEWISRNMRREGITKEQVIAAAREHEISKLDQVQLAVLEVDGDISIIPKDVTHAPGPKSDS